MKLREIVAKNVKKLRLGEGLTQSELAKRSRLDVRYINRLENHPQNIHLDHIEIIAAALGVAPSVLLQNRTNVKDPGARTLKKLESMTDEMKKMIKQVKIEIDSLD